MPKTDTNEVVVRKVCIKQRNMAIEQHRFHKGKFDDPETADKEYHKRKMQYWGGRITAFNDVYSVFTR